MLVKLSNESGGHHGFKRMGGQPKTKVFGQRSNQLFVLEHTHVVPADDSHQPASIAVGLTLVDRTPNVKTTGRQ
jgi:hypothetical protein